MNRTKAHQKLVDDILFQGGSLPYCRLWIRVVGFDETKRIKYGYKGEPDIDGILSCGCRVGIECKTGDAVLNKDQVKWKHMLNKFNAVYIEARSVEPVIGILKAHHEMCV